MSFRFQFRRGTTAERDASNPILAAGEPAVVLDSGQPAELVLGDGVTAMAGLRAAVWDDDARLTAAATATQPGDLGTAAVADVGDFASAAQGAKADAANAAVVPLPAATGTNDTTAIQAILTANPGKRITGRPGSSYRISAPLVIASGTTLDMTGCTVTLIAGSNCRMIQNAALSGSGARDVDITIRGGYWDRGANGGTTSNDAHSFVFHRADRVAMTDMRFNATGPCKYAFYFVDVTDATAERLYIDSTSDGVHITGPASRVIVRDISGKGDDDIVSFTGRDYTSYELTAGGGNISEITVERVVCRGGLDPNTVKLLPGAGMTLSNAVIRDISGSPATSAVVLYNDTVQPSTTGGTLDGVLIDGVTGSPGQRYVNVAHPDVRRLVIRNVVVTSNPTRAISLAGGTGAVVTDCVIDGVTAGTAFNQSLIHVGNPTTVNRLAITNVTARSVGSTTYLLITDGNIANLQLSNIYQENGYGGVVIGGGTCPLITINGYHSTASNNVIRVGANIPVEAHVTGVTAYPTSQFAIVVGATGSLLLRVGSIVDGGPLLSRTATQTMRAVGAGAKVNVSLLTPTAGDIVTNTNAALGCGTGPVVSNGTLWKHLYTGATT